MKQILAVIPLVTRKIRLFAWIEGFVFNFDGLVGWRLGFLQGGNGNGNGNCSGK